MHLDYADLMSQLCNMTLWYDVMDKIEKFDRLTHSKTQWPWPAISRVDFATKIKWCDLWLRCILVPCTVRLMPLYWGWGTAGCLYTISQPPVSAVLFLALSTVTLITSSSTALHSLDVMLVVAPRAGEELISSSQGLRSLVNMKSAPYSS